MHSGIFPGHATHADAATLRTIRSAPAPSALGRTSLPSHAAIAIDPIVLQKAACHSHPPWVRYGGLSNRTATIIPKQGE